MKIISYYADTVAKARKKAIKELGPEIVLISTQRSFGSKGIKITVALETNTKKESSLKKNNKTNEIYDLGFIEESLKFHRVPESLKSNMIISSKQISTRSAEIMFEKLLNSYFKFNPLQIHKTQNPFILVGPPGHGKTISVAKLVTRARLSGCSVGVINTDSIKVIAYEQIKSLTNILEVPIKNVGKPKNLPNIINAMLQSEGLVFIDTPGLNPYKKKDMDYLKVLIKNSSAEPILVLGADIDANEAAKMAKAFSIVGTKRIISTRLDITSRLGSMLSAAEQGNLALSEISLDSDISSGLTPASSMLLSKMLVETKDTN